MKLAVVQFEPKQFDVDVNLRKAERFIEMAKKRQANVIVFPEDFLTGPIFGKKEFVDFDGRFRGLFQKLAKKYKIDIVTGSFIEGDYTGWYNTSYYIDSKGKIRGKYRKINLWHPERKYLASGRDVSVFNTKFGKAALIICWDLMFPEMFRSLVKKGVKIVYCPSYWSLEDAGRGIKYDKEAEIKSVNALCTARAFENNILLVFANVAGRLEYKNVSACLIGRSQVTVPFKGPVKRLDHNKEGMFVIDLNYEKILRDAEVSYKIRSDLRGKYF